MYNISLLGTQTWLLQKVVVKHQVEAQQKRGVSTNSHGEDISTLQTTDRFFHTPFEPSFLYYPISTLSHLASITNPAKQWLQLIHHHMSCILVTYRVCNTYFTHCTWLTNIYVTASLLLSVLWSASGRPTKREYNSYFTCCTRLTNIYVSASLLLNWLQLTHHHLSCILVTYRVYNIYFTHCTQLTNISPLLPVLRTTSGRPTERVCNIDFTNWTRLN